MSKIAFYKSFRGYLALPALALLGLALWGCENFDLNEDPARSQLAVLPYENISELELGVTGAYDRMWAGLRMTTAWVSAWGGDDLTTHRASNKADFREYDKRAVTNGNARTQGTWNGVFAAIRAANTVLENAEGVELPERAEQDRLVGEAHFIRAYCYHHLIRVFEELPVITSVTPDFDITLSSREAVFAQIESDYLAAESLLPVSSTPGATRPNSGSARAFLARLYMDWAGFPTNDTGKYAQAASSAKQVIDNAANHGFSLVPDMATLYTLAGAANSEGVFTLSHCQPCGRGNRKTGKLGLPGDLGGWQESFAEIRFFEDMPENYRKEVTYHTDIPVNAAGNRAVANPADAASILPWTEFKDQQNPVFAKITGPWEDDIFNGFQNSRADYIMRYAEVLLTYAEASGRAGNVTDAAWEALNMVRRRSENLPVDDADPSVDLTSGDIAELAYTERKWELAGEYQRWYDLVRMQRVEQALSNRNPRVSIGTVFDADGNPTPTPLTEASNPITGSLGTDNYFAPIPPDELEQLPGLMGN
ncbi:MAG: RagB/SusD family nutrient uptake outer membrane protein [Bacteroidota bacterium]